MATLPLDVQQALKRQAPKALKEPLSKDVRKRFNRIKKEMIKEFMSLPVTQEILQGPDGINISGTLDGVSNLFDFIGFDRDLESIENSNNDDKVYQLNFSQISQYLIDNDLNF